MRRVDLWTDGSSTGGRGPGGWAAILLCGPHRKEISGGDPNATNNSMEITAVWEGIKALKEPCAVTVHTDSKLVIGWLSQGWKCKHDHIRVIRDDIFNLCKIKGHKLSFIHVPGHAGHELNERADTLAKHARKVFSEKSERSS